MCARAIMCLNLVANDGGQLSWGLVATQLLKVTLAHCMVAWSDMMACTLLCPYSFFLQWCHKYVGDTAVLRVIRAKPEVRQQQEQQQHLTDGGQGDVGQRTKQEKGKGKQRAGASGSGSGTQKQDAGADGANDADGAGSTGGNGRGRGGRGAKAGGKGQVKVQGQELAAEEEEVTIRLKALPKMPSVKTVD
eukprot:1159449-Pelagomonas_calceolata.AAC.1